jgi:FkbM family methyltransferase
MIGAFMRKLKDKHHFLTSNIFFEYIEPYFQRMKLIMNSDVLEQDEDSICFYNQNHERINAIVNMLADEQSKKEYLGIIKFRQTRNKKDYPICEWKSEYFIKELKLGKDEVFIDCGAYTGDTIYDFLRHCKKQYKRIVSFEPDSKNFEKLKKKYGENSKITLINLGLYDRDGIVYFNNSGDVFSRVVEESDPNQKLVSIQVKALDNLNLDYVSFIKMDIEGVELNALKGAEKTILRDKPKLAICIYHSNEDMIRIAEYIHNLVPEYKLYVRHHASYSALHETVLYALP